MQTKVRYHKTSLVLAGLSCLLALAVLFGWWFQISFLVRGFSTLAPMHLSSALLFILLGMCLLLQITVPGKIVAVLSLIGGLFSLLVLLPHFGGWDSKVDVLIDHAHSMGHMSASAALTFFMLFLGCAFYNIRVNTGKLWISCSLGGLSFATGLASVIGYLAMLDIDYG